MSRSMHGEGPRKPHLLPGGEGGLAAEIFDLREDTDRAFNRLEGELDAYSTIEDEDSVVLAGQHKLNFEGDGVLAAIDLVDPKKVNVTIPGGASVGSASPADIGATDAGSSTSAAHEDHVHAHGDQLGGTLHADVISGGDAGFMTGADKARLDGMEDGATNTPLGSTSPADIGSSDAGSATSASREDHVHAHGNQAGGSLHADVVAGGDSGFMSGVDKTKLDGIGSVLVRDTFHIGPLGSDSTGDGSEGLPFATLQKCYDTWFPTGTPTTWAEFDRKRLIRVQPGTTAAGAGNLAASCCNLVIMGCGVIGDVTYDQKSEVMATFTGASANYELNTLYFVGGGIGWNTSSADTQLVTGNVTVSNYNVAARELQVSFLDCQTQLKSQCRSGVPGGASGAIYVCAHNTVFIYCESGVNGLGNAPITFSMLRDSIFRNQVNATKGAIGFSDMQGCYFRRGFVGDPGVATMVSTGVFRGWEDNHIKYAFDVSSAGAQQLQMDYTTWKFIQEQASPNWGTCTVKLTSSTYGASGARPTTGIPIGAFYFDTSLAAGAGKPIWWNGSAWVDATGASV